MFFVQNVAKLGLDIFLVRAPGRLDKAMLDQVFVLLVATGLAATLGLAAASGAVARALRMPDLQGPLAVALAATIP